MTFFKKLSINNNKAVALILAVFILVAFSLLGLMATNLLTSQSAQMSNHLNSIKALYLAEAGMSYFREYILPWEKTFVGQASITKILGNSDYDFFTITYSAVSARTATVTVTGTTDDGSNSEVNRTIKITFSQDANQEPFRSFTNFNVYSGDSDPAELSLYDCDPGPTTTYKRWGYSGNGYFASSSFKYEYGPIDGNLYLGNGNYTAACPYGPAPLTGDCYASGTIADIACFGTRFITGTAHCPNCAAPCYTYTGPNPPGPSTCSNLGSVNWPTKPDIIQTYYNALNTRTPRYVGNVALDSTNLSGENRYYQGNVTINPGAQINGPGNIIATGIITISSSIAAVSAINDRVGLIGQRIVIANNNSTDWIKIGGINLDPKPCCPFLISETQKGAILYAKGDGGGPFEIDVTGTGAGILIKGTVLVPASGGIQNTVHLGTACEAIYSIMQGIIYARKTDRYLGKTYGHLYVDEITNNYPLEGGVADIVPYEQNPPGPTNVADELRLDVRGLYGLTESTPAYN